MDRLITLFESDFSSNLLTALLHSLWQGLVIAALLIFHLRTSPAKNASARYTASVIALAAIVFCGLFTWAILNYEPAPASETYAATTSPLGATSIIAPAETGERIASPDTTFIASGDTAEDSAGANWRIPAMCLWLAGVAVMLIRAILVIAGGTRLQRQCKALEDEHILGLVEQLRKSLGIARRIRVTVSEHIVVPGVVGFIRPILLLPASIVSGVPADDLKAILAHELAHIRRYDYLVNFCQMVIEAILFFNPAVWWISRQIRIEREACCDNAGIAATGQRIRYAEVLAEWAQTLKQTNVKFAAAIGFGKPDESSSMLERIRRIVIAEHRPRLKVSWYIAAITLILSFAVLIGLWGGTTMTVALAGKLLTPQQRIDRIQEIEKSFPTIEEREYTEADQITISGTVKTVDNEPLNDTSYIRIRFDRPGHSGSKGISISSQPDWSFTKDGKFSTKVEYGIIWLQIKSDGYAPAFAGPLEAEPGGQIKNLLFVLDKGFPAKVKVVNELNEPIRGANLAGGYQQSPEVKYNDFNMTTDKDGFAILENTADMSTYIGVRADGYQSEEFKDIKLSSDSPVILELKKAAITNGIVLAKSTGKPVPDAAVRILWKKGISGSHSYGENGPLLATTDKNGRFALSTLRSDSRYLLSVSTTEHGYKFLYNVIAGQEDLIVHLPEKFSIKGRITGPMEKLKEKDGKYVINYSSGIVYENNSSWDSGGYAEVEVRDGQGFFEITEIAGNRLSLGTGSYRMTLDIENESSRDVVIDLADKVTETGVEYIKREVILEFDYPRDYPAPKGTLLFRYIDPDFASNTYKNQDVTITDGRGKIEIPTPGKIAYDNSGITGYWFNEESEIKIPYAEEPFVVTIPAVPAGLIYGEIFNSDGSKANNVLVSVVVIEKSPLMGESPFLNVEGKNHASTSDLDAKYVISPLPLEGKYVVIAHSGYTYLVSEELEINEKMPIRQLDMTLPEGISLEVKVIDENGKPMPTAPIEFHYSTPWSHGFSREATFTNILGEFLINNLNPDVPGYYQVIIKNVTGYRPAKMKIENFDMPLEIKLEKAHIVTGTVIDEETGWPIPGVEVYALPEDLSNPEPTTYLDADEPTDQNGQFKFTTMAEREYNLNVRSARLAKPQSNVIVTGGQTEPVVIRVKISEWSKLKPRQPD